MACFLLRGPCGDRWVPEMEPYTKDPDEYIVEGMIDWQCGPLQVSNPPYIEYRKCSSCGELGVYEST